MNEKHSESLTSAVEPIQPTGIARRRLLRAGLAATPVVLTLSGRSAMACSTGTCLSPTTFASIGACNGTATSHTVTGHTAGCKPDDWKPTCPSGPTFKRKGPADCVPFVSKKTTSNTNCNWSQANWSSYAYLDSPDTAYEKTRSGWGFKSGTKFNEIFPGCAESRSISRILLDDGDNSLAKHLCAAYMNAQTISDFCMTKAEVVQLATTGCLVPGKVQADGGLAFLKQTC